MWQNSLTVQFPDRNFNSINDPIQIQNEDTQKNDPEKEKNPIELLEKEKKRVESENENSQTHLEHKMKLISCSADLTENGTPMSRESLINPLNGSLDENLGTGHGKLIAIEERNLNTQKHLAKNLSQKSEFNGHTNVNGTGNKTGDGNGNGNGNGIVSGNGIGNGNGGGAGVLCYSSISVEGDSNGTAKPFSNTNIKNFIGKMVTETEHGTAFKNGNGNSNAFGNENFPEKPFSGKDVVLLDGNSPSSALLCENIPLSGDLEKEEKLNGKGVGFERKSILEQSPTINSGLLKGNQDEIFDSSRGEIVLYGHVENKTERSKGEEGRQEGSEIGRERGGTNGSMFPTHQQMEFSNTDMGGRGMGGGGEVLGEGNQTQSGSEDENMNILKAKIVSHPLYEQLLDAHVSCLKVATPLDRLPFLELQLERSELVAAKYLAFTQNSSTEVCEDSGELDRFMAQFVVLLRSFRGQLEEHVKVHAREAVLACWELEQSLLSITGMEAGPGNGATMSDDEDLDGDEADVSNFGRNDNGGTGPYGPLVPSDNERNIMERMREELKMELKNGYRDKISDVREEIMRKRRAGKLPGDTTAVLKTWWNAHAKWPYPTEEEKAVLVNQTGLELKQINNWFINQRKRNWHTSPSQQPSSKATNKRKQSL